MQLQWRWGCSSDTQCCQELPPDSYLRSLGITSLVPQTAAACADLPGCMASSYCWPSWGSDTCRNLLNRTSCSAEEQCQVRASCGCLPGG